LETDSIPERKKLISLYYYEIMGLGSAFFIFFMIPVLGILIAPAAGIVGAAMMRYENNA
jgi:uncharacterized protein involved in cysteine biosynthesis